MTAPDYTAAVGDILAGTPPATAPKLPDYGAAVDSVVGDQSAVIKSNVYSATAQNPDTAAEHQKLARQIGTTPEGVALDPVAAKQQAAAQNTDTASLLQHSPVTSQFLTNPQNAAIAHDDISNLTSIEAGIAGNREVASPYNPSWGQSLRDWINDATGATERRLTQSANDYSIASAAQASGETPEQFRTKLGGDGEIPDQFVNKLVNMATFGLLPDMAGPAHTPGGGVAGGAGALAGFMTPGGPLKATEYLGSKLGFNLFEHTAQEAFVKALLKDVGHGAATLGTATALSQIGENIDSSDVGSFAAKEGKAFGEGGALGAIFGVAGRVLPDNTFAQIAARIATVNVAVDSFNGTSPFDKKRSLEQKIFDYGLNSYFALKGAGRVEGGWVKDAPETTSDTNGSPPDGGDPAGAVSILKMFAQMITPHIENVGKATAADSAANRMQQINAMATESKLRARDPDAFKAFINEASQNSPVSDLYIDAKLFAQTAGKDLLSITKAMPDVGDQLPTALTAGTDIRIPVADFAAHLAGSDMATTLIPHMKTDPEAFSQVEAQEYLKTMTPQIEADVQKALSAKEEKAATQASSEAVRQKILDQFTDANRFTPDVNNAVATYFSSFVDTMAQRNNTTPEAVMSLLGDLKVKAESAGGGFDQEGSAPTFYSALEKHLTDLPQGKGSPEQWAGIVKNLTQKGVKQEEIDWSGVHDWLKEQKGGVTKADLLDYIKAHQIKVDEVVKSDIDPGVAWSIEGREGDGFYAVNEDTGERISEVFDDRYAAEAAAENYSGADRYGGNTKFSQHTLPGGKNYRELLMTLPPKADSVIKRDTPKEGFHISAGTTATSSEGYFFLSTPTGAMRRYSSQEGAEMAMRAMGAYSDFVKGDDYNSSHYPDEKNIVAHLRFNDRKDASGAKTMFVEEIQSDWHQAGRDKGYKPDLSAEQKRLQELRDSFYKWVEENPKKNGADWRAEFPELSEESLKLDAEISKNQNGVPDAPFKTSWPELAFKRALMHAVEKGYDKVAWTTGEQQAARYDLSKQVDSIGYRSDGEGTYEISAIKDGESVITQHGKTVKELEDMVGKEIAKKIADGEGVPRKGGGGVKDLSGIDLKVGGEGMKTFYDKMLPSMVNKLVKKWGGKVGETELPDTKEGLQTDGVYSSKVHSLEITPAMRESVSSGLPLFQDKLGSYNPKTLTMSFMKGANLSTPIHEGGHFFLDAFMKLANNAEAPEGIKADAQKLMDWVGVKDADVWGKMTTEEQRAGHEKFAESIEHYMMKGEAPSLELQPIFSRFRSWLLNVYSSIKDFLASHPDAGQLDPEIQSVFDRMLATDEQISRAQTARGMKPLFDTPEAAGMKPEDFAAYQDQSADATSTAASDLDARRIKDMQYASNARSKVLKELQREAASKRTAIREEVTKEVNKEPVYRAENFIRKGELDPEQLKGMNQEERRAITELGLEKGNTKLNIGDLKQMYGDDVNAPWRQLDKGLVSANGMHPDTLAEMFDYNSGNGLINDLLTAESKADKIRGLTDQRMLERHGDLTDPKSMAAAADRAIHNDVRAKVIATELNALNKQLGNKSLLTKVAKQFAEQAVAKLPANKINPNLYISAAAKAGKAADAAFKAGDIKEAAEQKKNQLINQYAVKAAFEQKVIVEKGLTFLKRFDNKAFREKIPGAYLEQIDGLLAKYDLRKNPTSDPTRDQLNLAKWLESQRQAGFEPYAPDDIVNGRGMHYGDMSVEQFRGLLDTVRSMKHMADNLKEVTIAGQRMAVETAVQELLKPLVERGTKFSKEDLLNPPARGTDSFFSVALHKMASILRLVDSDLKPQEFKRNEYDLHELNGPFGRLLFEPMFERNYWKVQQLKEISVKFGEMGKQLGKEWQKSLYDLVDNKTLLDPDLSEEGSPVPMKITRAKMLGIARHVGNESNFDKLTRGYEWQPEAVWKFLHDNMTEKDWQATQAQWSIFEKYWPEVEALSRRLGGVPPGKIPLRPFDTKFGKMEGGYSPIDYDPIRSKLSAKYGDIMAEPHEQIGSEPAYKATTTFNGSMQNRQAGYTDRVNLDYHGVESRLRDTIHDLAYREVLIDANKLITDPKFRSQFMGTFGREDYRGLQSWLRGIRDVNKDESQIKGFEKFLQYARTGVVMTGIAYRFSTVLKHGSSAALKSLGYLGDGAGAKYFAARAARMATGNASADIAGAQAKFPEIASRMNQMDRDYKVGTKSMYHAEDWRAKNDRFGHAMVAWSDMITAVPTAWAAYDRATIEGIPKSQGGTGEPMTEKQAVAYANKVVREAHGTALEANRSLFLQARGVKGLFGTIYGFMNNTYGQMGDLLDKTVVGGHFDNKPVLMARAMATIVAPAMMAAWVSGQFNDKDHWWKQGAQAILGEVAGTVPFVRDAYSMMEHGHGGEVAPIRVIEDAVKVALDAYKGVHGQKSKWVQDTANAIGELFHIGGLGQAGKSLQYLKDVKEGVQNPRSMKDFATGVTIGPAPKH